MWKICTNKVYYFFFVLYHIYVVIFIISQTPDVMNCVDLF